MGLRVCGRVWHMGCNIGLLTVVILFLHGCAVKHSVERPVGSVTSPHPRSIPVPSQRPAPAVPAPAPLPDSRRESVPVAEEGKAAGTLLASARHSVQAGQFSQAEMMLERALRLEPRNARLWYEMAQVKYGQKEYGQVIQFCVKSNSLAGKDYELLQRNRLLMEKAYLQLGEPEKARQARIKSG